MDVDAYRTRAEHFLQQHDREYLQHFAGHKPGYELDALYARHEDLFTGEAVEWLRAQWERARGPAGERCERERRSRWLLAFAVEGHLGASTRRHETELARREASLTLEAGGRALPFRQAAAAQMNEPDAQRRAMIEEARLEAVERELTPLRREAWELSHALARELGWRSYRAMGQELTGVDLDALAGETAAFLAATAERHPQLLDAELRRTAGVTLQAARRSDLPRWLRDVQADARHPPEELLPAWEAVRRGLGLEGSRVHLDVEARSTKSPRAFCAPVRVPEEVHLVVPPMGGRDDYLALFHEGGHAEHYASVDPALPFEFRRLGDNAITEAFAFLFEGLVEEQEAGDGARARRCYLLRRYAGKLHYELELHDGARSLDALAPAYARRLTDATAVPWPAQTYLEDVDPGFYVACYLRAWALAARLRTALRERFGERWHTEPAAGARLRTLWREGQRRDPDELAEALDNGGPLRFSALAAAL